MEKEEEEDQMPLTMSPACPWSYSWHIQGQTPMVLSKNEG